MKTNESFWFRIIIILSMVIVSAVAFLIFGPRPERIEGSLDVSALPLLNAVLNGISSVLLVVAFIFIRQKKINLHRRTMLTAFGISAMFLVSYVTYHWYMRGPKLYEGEWTTLYYVILLTHIPLAVVILPMAMVTLNRGWSGLIEKHKRIARITLPIWLYVSVTGVLIYLMLY